MMENAIEIKNVSKKVKNQYILENVNLNIEKGKIYGIIGRNGSGKSILFKSISGLIKPTEGEIKVFNELIVDGNIPTNFGILFDTSGFLPHYSGFKNLQYLASIKNKITDDDIKETINSVGLNPTDEKKVKKYSLGMKQRLGIAQAIMEKPQLLILDEPMNGLDDSGVEDIRNLILSLNDKGVTILLSSHNREDIDFLCHHVIKIDNGKIVKIKENSLEEKSNQ